MRFTFFVLLTCIALTLPAGQVRGRDVGKDQGGSEKVAVDLRPVYRVLQLEQEIAVNLKLAVRGENEPVIKALRRRLKKAREEAPPDTSVCWEVVRRQEAKKLEVARRREAKRLAGDRQQEIEDLEQEIAVNLKLAVRGENEPIIKEQRRRLRELRRQLQELSRQRSRLGR
jgi:hypothetical protein